MIHNFDYDVVPKNSDIKPSKALTLCLWAAFYMWIDRCKKGGGTYQTTKSVFDLLNPIAEESVIFTRSLLDATNLVSIPLQSTSTSEVETTSPISTSASLSLGSIISLDFDQKSGLGSGSIPEDLESLRLPRPPESVTTLTPHQQKIERKRKQLDRDGVPRDKQEMDEYLSLETVASEP